MTDFGYIRVAAAMPVVKLADPASNAAAIIALARKAIAEEVSLVAFPELCMTGYTCADLFGHGELIRGAEESVRKIVEFSRGKAITMVVGAPLRHNFKLYNCAVVIRDGDICGIVPKINLPSYGEFYETRWFSCGEGLDEEIEYAGCSCLLCTDQIFRIGDFSFCCEICEDLWVPIPPSSRHSLSGALLTVNLSASNEIIGKHGYRRELVAQQSSRCISGYIYCSAGFGESTQDLVFAGSSMIYEYGTSLCENKRFQMRDSMIVADIDCERLAVLRQKSTTWAPEGDCEYYIVNVGEPAETDFGKRFYRTVEPHPFVPEGPQTDKRCTEILSTQVLGLASRLSHIGCKTAVVGISGGLDSALALLVTVLAADRCGWTRERVIGVTMPGYGTTSRTRTNAEELMEALGVRSEKISITAACDQHFKDIKHECDVHDITYENSQARERTQILMDIANQTGGIVIGTGDLSELALGWATYNGDHMSMYGVNCSVPKTLVKYLIRWAADNHFVEKATSGRTVREILADIIDTPISPELLPCGADGKIAQKSEDTVGPYELHDFFLYNFFRYGYSAKKILFLAKKAFSEPVAEEGTMTMPVGHYDDETLEKWLRTFIRRFFGQQFKRSCLPDGPKVGSVSLSPRGDWRMPSDAKSELFLNF